MEVKLTEIVNRVYLNSNKNENQLGVTFLKAMAKEYGKDFFRRRRNGRWKLFN